MCAWLKWFRVRRFNCRLERIPSREEVDSANYENDTYLRTRIHPISAYASHFSRRYFLNYTPLSNLLNAVFCIWRANFRSLKPLKIRKCVLHYKICDVNVSFITYNSILVNKKRFFKRLIALEIYSDTVYSYFNYAILCCVPKDFMKICFRFRNDFPIRSHFTVTDLSCRLHGSKNLMTPTRYWLIKLSRRSELPQVACLCSPRTTVS